MQSLKTKIHWVFFNNGQNVFTTVNNEKCEYHFNLEPKYNRLLKYGQLTFNIYHAMFVHTSIAQANRKYKNWPFKYRAMPPLYSNNLI